jgi:hypothetical protein
MIMESHSSFYLKNQLKQLAVSEIPAVPEGLVVVHMRAESLDTITE